MSLKIKFVCEVKSSLSVGEVSHMVKIFSSGLWADLTMCGHRWDNSKFWRSSDELPVGLPVCPGCLLAWKEYEDSPWRAWMSKAILLLVCALLLTACGQPVSVMSMSAHQTATPTEVVSAAPSETCYLVIAAESLHVRDDHDYESGVLGYLYRDQVVFGVGAPVVGWVPVRSTYSTFGRAGVAGWVNMRYVQVVTCRLDDRRQSEIEMRKP